MILKEVTSIGDIKAILCEPAIYDTITSDDCNDFSDFDIIKDNCFLIGGYLDGKIIALACYHKFRDGVKYHPNVLPECRSKYASEFIDKSLIDACPVYLEIPEIYKHLIILAKKHRFEVLDINKGSHTKDKKTCDTIIMRLKDGDH